MNVLILLIEDSPTCAELTVTELQRWRQDIQCTTVLSQADALAELAAQRYDLVILDLTLLDTRGLMTVIPILQAAQPQGTPVLIYTGAAPDLAPTVLEAGAAAFIGKETPPHILHAVLTELVRGRAASGGHEHAGA